MKRKFKAAVSFALSASLLTAALAVPSSAAPPDNETTLTVLNARVASIDGNDSAADSIQFTLTPDNSSKPFMKQSCSLTQGAPSAVSFMWAPSGTVTVTKAGYHTEPESWHVDAGTFNYQHTIEFTLIPDGYSEDLRSASQPTVRPYERNYENYVELKTATPDATVYYTTDGSDPTYQSQWYTGPILIDKNRDVTVKAIATKAGYVKSSVMEYSYQAPVEPEQHSSHAIFGKVVNSDSSPVKASIKYSIPGLDEKSADCYEDGTFTIYTRYAGTITFTAEGYDIDPVAVGTDYSGENLTVTARSKAAAEDREDTVAPAEDQTPAQEEAQVPNTVKLYFMTGSSIDDPGEVFAEFDVPKNARGNRVTLSKTVNTLGRVPEKEGYTFSHWAERSLKDASKMGNTIGGVIRINEADQYIYAQYKKNSEVQDPTEKESVEEPTVYVYKDSNYKGENMALSVGRYRKAVLSSVGNDAISSIKVPKGYTVTLYENDNFTGRSLECTDDITFLGNGAYRFNDVTSSIVVAKND